MATIGYSNTAYLIVRKRVWKLVATGAFLVVVVLFTEYFMADTTHERNRDYVLDMCKQKESTLKNGFDRFNFQKNVSLFNKKSLESIQSQISIKLIREVQNNWVKAPSELPYNITPDSVSDLTAVQRLHKLVLELFGVKKNGFFIECGAFDGVSLSNTLHLEQEHNWTGLLVEADPKYYAELVQKHRKSWIINACLAIYPYQHQAQMTRIKNQGALSRITEIASKTFLSESQAENFEAHCFPLATILSSICHTLDVDYFSLDIENAELKVLKTIPWDLVYIKVISLEAEADTFDAINEFLITKNYKFFKAIRGPWIHDYVFIHNQFKNHSLLKKGPGESQ